MSFLSELRQGSANLTHYDKNLKENLIQDIRCIHCANQINRNTPRKIAAYICRRGERMWLQQVRFEDENYDGHNILRLNVNSDLVYYKSRENARELCTQISKVMKELGFTSDEFQVYLHQVYVDKAEWYETFWLKKKKKRYVTLGYRYFVKLTASW